MTITEPLMEKIWQLRATPKNRAPDPTPCRSGTLHVGLYRPSGLNSIHFRRAEGSRNRQWSARRHFSNEEDGRTKELRHEAFSKSYPRTEVCVYCSLIEFI
jgi:hypothetical protein